MPVLAEPDEEVGAHLGHVERARVPLKGIVSIYLSLSLSVYIYIYIYTYIV